MRDKDTAGTRPPKQGTDTIQRSSVEKVNWEKSISGLDKSIKIHT